MSASTGTLSLVDFTAYELPTKKWMSLIRPRMRLRVRVQNRSFVSSSAKVSDRIPGAAVSGVYWAWNDEERFPRPTFADDDVFEVEVERRFLLWYSCIRRTKPVTLDQVRTGEHCALPLYDKQRFTEMPEDRFEIGEIMFTLRGVGEDASSEGKISSAYS